MARTIKPAFISLIACNILLGCYNSQHDEAKGSTLCFRNEQPYPNTPTLKDIEELNLFIENGKVTGTYNWLPAEKDKRTGDLTGSIEGNVVEALYTFSQEGTTDTASVKVILEDDKAVISGGKPELGLKASIHKADCGLLR